MVNTFSFLLRLLTAYFLNDPLKTCNISTLDLRRFICLTFVCTEPVSEGHSADCAAPLQVHRPPWSPVPVLNRVSAAVVGIVRTGITVHGTPGDSSGMIAALIRRSAQCNVLSTVCNWKAVLKVGKWKTEGKESVVCLIFKRRYDITDIEVWLFLFFTPDYKFS